MVPFVETALTVDARTVAQVEVGGFPRVELPVRARHIVFVLLRPAGVDPVTLCDDKRTVMVAK